jgi:TolA-binding protein
LAEVGAKAQLQLAECRLAQKRYRDAAQTCLAMLDKYGYEEWSAAALLQAAEAYVLLQQTEQARQLLQRLLKEYPNTPAAKTAKQRLTKL